ncbi:MAG: hypothetical protein GY822_21410, partial [Deltaproteobacteria bacterium]|nr:hypothetical protein [Deltaproteobacteria bacterium]
AEDAKAHARIASEEVVQTSLKTSEKEREEKHEHLMQQMRSDHQAQMNDIQSLRKAFRAQVNANVAARANIAAEEVEADNESRNHAQLSSGSHCAVVNSATLGSNFTKLCEQVAKSIPQEERAEMQEAMAKPDFPETLRQHTDEYLTQSKLAKINADAAACTNIAAEETTAVPDTFSPQKEAPTVSSAVGTEAASTKEEPSSPIQGPAPKPAPTTKQQTAAKKTQQQAAAKIPPAKNDEHMKPSPRSAVNLTDGIASNVPHEPDKILPAITTQQEEAVRIPPDGSNLKDVQWLRRNSTVNLVLQIKNNNMPPAATILPDASIWKNIRGPQWNPHDADKLITLSAKNNNHATAKFAPSINRPEVQWLLRDSTVYLKSPIWNSIRHHKPANSNNKAVPLPVALVSSPDDKPP